MNELLPEIIKTLEWMITDIKFHYTQTIIDPYEGDTNYSPELTAAINLLAALKKYGKKD